MLANRTSGIALARACPLFSLFTFHLSAISLTSLPRHPPTEARPRYDAAIAAISAISVFYALFLRLFCAFWAFPAPTARLIGLFARISPTVHGLALIQAERSHDSFRGISGISRPYFPKHYLTTI